MEVLKEDRRKVFFKTRAKTLAYSELKGLVNLDRGGGGANNGAEIEGGVTA